MRNEQVINSLRQKFMARNTGSNYIMDNNDEAEYEKAKAEGNVMQMLAIKSGTLARAKQQEQFNSELENIDIKAVVSEMKRIAPKLQKIEEETQTKAKGMKQAILHDFEAQEQALFKRGIAKNSRQHLLLQEEIQNRLDEVDNSPEVKNIQRQLFDLSHRMGQLEFLSEKYKEDNKEIINEIRREQVKNQLIDLGLIE